MPDPPRDAVNVPNAITSEGAATLARKDLR
jgi:hypothetical protein